MNFEQAPNDEKSFDDVQKQKNSSEDFGKKLKRWAGIAGAVSVGYLGSMNEVVAADSTNSVPKGKEPIIQSGGTNVTKEKLATKAEGAKVSDKYRGMKNVVLTTEEYDQLQKELPVSQGIGRIVMPFEYSKVMLKPGEQVGERFRGIGTSIFKEYDSKTPWTKDVLGKSTPGR